MKRQIEAYFAGRLQRFDLPLAPAGTPFRQTVWRQMAAVPYGETCSYGDLAAALGSGLWGIENRIEPGPPVEGNAYDRRFPKRLTLPATLWEAAQRLKRSKAARELFGDAFVDHYAASREWEEREFRKHITDWEMERYFEII